jgi:predicted transport protein
VTAQYDGPKAGLRPLYEAVLAKAQVFGDDVEVAPKKTYVSLRRHRQFALIRPATRSQREIGLNLKGEAGGARLVPTTGMCTHLVRISGADELDPELVGWLRAAYEQA